MAPNMRRTITARIVQAIHNGTPPWRKPWSASDTAGVPTNAVSKRRYEGVNVLLLDLAKTQRGSPTNWWATAVEWKALGGRVRRRPEHIHPGQWATKIVVWRPGYHRIPDQNGGVFKLEYLCLAEKALYNLDQVDGVPPSLFGAPPPDIDYSEIEELVTATGADIRFGGNKSFYSRVNDYIQLPARAFFSDQATYTEVVLHELIHWSERRCGWKGKCILAELAAEIGACFLSSALHLPQSDDLSNHRLHVAAWLKELEADPKAIFTAASQAWKATDYILSFRRPQAVR